MNINQVVPLQQKEGTLLRIGLFLGSLFIAIFASILLSNSAFADHGGDHSGINVGGGGGGEPAGEVRNPSTPIGKKPPNEADYAIPNPNNLNFQVNCSDWNGSGSWQPGSNCNVSLDAAINAAPAPQRGGGRVLDSPKDNYRPGGTYSASDSNPGVCAPDGQKSAYAQTWNKITRETFSRTRMFTWSTANQVWYGIWSVTVLEGTVVSYTKIGCVLPSEQKSSVTCFWNYGGNEYYSFDRKKALGAWTLVANRPALSSDPSAPSGGSGTTAPNCERTGTAYVQFDAIPDLLGYYRMYIDYNYKTFNNTRWLNGAGAVVYSTWTSGSALKGSATTWWTYSCQANAANSTQGPYNSQGALPNVDANLNPATCPQVNWQCKLGTPTIVGLDKTAIANGTVSPTSPVSVLRNGEKIPLTFSTIKIVDTSTAVDIDVTNGGSSPGVRNVTSLKYTNLVKAGSTPFVGTDPNASNQYFKLYKNSSTTAVEKFGSWFDKANSNVDKPIAFYWASDSASTPFVVQRQWKVTAEFLVPQGGSMGSSSSPANVGMKWKVGTYDCKDYAGRGSSRVDKGILTANSNPIQVVRSAGSGK